FLARGKTKDASLFLHRSWGTGFFGTGENKGYFVFVAPELGNRILLLPSPRRGRGAGGEGLCNVTIKMV
ncbi:hypothetical protein, partial [Coleofasciculus sp.]